MSTAEALQLRELYQSMIIEHGRHPRHFGRLVDATHHQEGFNPLCGDKIILDIKIENRCIKKIAFEGCGCAISMASASLMTEHVLEKSIDEVDELFHLFHSWVTSHSDTFEKKEKEEKKKKEQKEENQEKLKKLGKLAVLGGVREFPIRVKCATLAWHTLKAILAGSNSKETLISTE